MSFVSTNNLDDIAIYLGLRRLSGETDAAFVSRIKRFSKIGYGTDYKTSVCSINEQVGLQQTPILKITSSVPFNITVTQESVSIIKYITDTDIKYYNVFINIPVTKDSSGNIISSPLKKLIDLISLDEHFTINIIDDNYASIEREYILGDANFAHKTQIISKKRTLLGAKAIMPSSITSEGNILSKRVDDIQKVLEIGDYYFDEELKYLEIASDNQSPFVISYTEYSHTFIFNKTRLNIIPIMYYTKYGISDNLVNLFRLIIKDRSIGTNGS